MESKTSLKELLDHQRQLEERIERLEALNPECQNQNKALSLISSVRMKSQEDKIQELIKPFHLQVQKNNLACNWAKLKTLAVQFVEEVAPKIALIVGFALKGEFKLGLCIDLLKSVFGMIPLAIADEINEVVDLLFNKTKNSDGTTSRQIEMKKRK